ncbi:MAG: hypothetical protein ACPKOI_08160, partial [Pleomorphochaeta sp.]
QSFYYHFSNIYELVQWTFSKDVEKQLQNKVNYKNWQEGFLVILSYCKKYYKKIQKIYKCL